MRAPFRGHFLSNCGDFVVFFSQTFSDTSLEGLLGDFWTQKEAQGSSPGGADMRLDH